MDPVYKVLPKEGFFCKGLVVLSIKAVNVMWPRLHLEAEWDIFTQVVACNLDKITCGVPEILF